MHGWVLWADAAIRYTYVIGWIIEQLYREIQYLSPYGSAAKWKKIQYSCFPIQCCFCAFTDKTEIKLINGVRLEKPNNRENPGLLIDFMDFLK